MSPNIPPDEERQHGSHTDSFYPGLIRSVWKFGPIRITRERKYHERTNINPKSVAWIVAVPMETYRLGIKHERDCPEPTNPL